MNVFFQEQSLSVTLEVDIVTILYTTYNITHQM